MVDGKRHRETFATASLARRWLEGVRAKAHLGQLDAPVSQRGQPMFAVIFERYRTERMQDRDAGVFRHYPDAVWLIRWSIEQGARLSESLNLRWRDIDFDRQTLSLERVKNDRYREEHGPEVRPMTRGAQRVLTEKRSGMDRQPEDDALLFDVGERALFSVLFGRMTKRAAIQDLTFHDLRHEATSRLARFLNPMELMRVTGHRDMKSLNRYYQPVPADIADKTG